jgi:hypothetical protein
MGHFFQAGNTPCGPEIDDDQSILTGQFPERKVVAFNGGDFELRDLGWNSLWQWFRRHLFERHKLLDLKGIEHSVNRLRQLGKQNGSKQEPNRYNHVSLRAASQADQHGKRSACD